MTMIAAALGMTSPKGGPAYLGHSEDGLVRKHGLNQLVPDVVHGDAIGVNHVRFEEPVISAKRPAERAGPGSGTNTTPVCDSMVVPYTG